MSNKKSENVGIIKQNDVVILFNFHLIADLGYFNYHVIWRATLLFIILFILFITITENVYG